MLKRHRYMKRTSENSLMALIVVIVVAFACLTAYYQSTYKDLSIDYQEKLNEMDVLSEMFNETANELAIKRERADVLGYHYKEMKKKNKKLETELNGSE